MAALTRIRNNQVYNSDINASAKIVPGSITGGLFAPAITYAGNLTVSNLFVYGNTSSLDSVSIVSSDPTIILNRNFSGSNTYDVGLILGRGNQTNTAIVWNESNKEFAFLYTSATTAESYYGTVPNAGYANIHAYGGLFNNITSTTSTITNLVTGNARVTNGYLDNTVIGANTANSAAFTTITATGTANFADTLTAATVNALNIGNTGATITGTHNGPVNGPFNGTIGATTPNSAAFTTITANVSTFGNLTITGNLNIIGNSSVINSSDLSIQDSIINLHTSANLAPWTFNDGKDIGFKLHYYDDILVGGDNLAFLGRANDTGYLEFYSTGVEGVGNVFTGSTYGTFKTGEIQLGNTTASTSTTTGALVISGGAGIAGNINANGNITSNGYVTATGNISTNSWLLAGTNIASPLAKLGCLTVDSSTISNWDTSNNINVSTAGNNGNVVINGNGNNSNLIVQGNTLSGYQNLLVTNGVTGQVGIKIAPNAISNYTSFQVNATDSMMIPIGLTGSRPPPGSERKGMLRFNSSSNLMEYWDGAGWNSGGVTFTLITADEFVGDGVQTNFSLSQNGTTNGSVVSINGLVQIPTTAYTVTGNVLTFTAPPSPTDYIDARTLVTTVSVTSILDGTTELAIADTQQAIYARNNSGNIWVANSSTFFNGGISAFNANTSLTQNTLTTIDTFSKTKFRSAKYIVTVSDFSGAKYQSAELLVVHDGTTATATIFGVVSTSGSGFVTYGASVSGANVILQANSTSATSYASVQQIYNAV